MKTKKIFVYGTLKENYPNYDRFIKKYNGKLLGRAKLYGYSMFMDYGIPFITKENGGIVFGEVFEFTIKDYEKAIEPLDFLESAYNRTKGTVFLECDHKKSNEVEVEFYTIPKVPNCMRKIESGEYVYA